MVLCRFYQQGTCRYGNNCKYDHQMPGDNRYTNTTSVLLRSEPVQPQQYHQRYVTPFQQQWHASPLQQQQQQPSSFQQQPQHHHQQQQQQNTGTNIDVNILVKSVVSDMLAAEKGGQWLLSTYAPFKEKPQFPDFIDYSMEEIRFMFYEAVKKNTLDQYKYNLQVLLQQAMLKIKALQNPTVDIINTLKQLYNAQPINEPATIPQPNIFAKQPQPPQQSFFSNSVQIKPQQSIFTGQQTQFQFNQPQQPPPPQQQQQQPNFTQQQTNIFQHNFKGGFNNPESGTNAQQHSTSIFNTNNNQATYNEEFYSKLEELSEDDKNWFNSDDIDDLSKIPEKPPTFQMCF